MRVGTVLWDGRDRPAVERDGSVWIVDAVESTLELIARWPLPLELHPDAALDAAHVRLRPPVMPRKLICVGTNYRDHVDEMAETAGVHLREEPFPFGFLKPPTTALTGSGTPVQRPAHGQRLDWEAELAVVIGDPSAASVDDPLAAVFGYSMLNDLSLRDFLPFPHALGLDALVSKGFEGSAPFGPWITLASDVPDPQDLPVRLSVNGELMQDSSTAQMIFDLRAIVGHYLRVLRLEPGDVIATGTPAGVGAGRRPPRFLAAGDVIEIVIGDLGTLVTPIEDARGDERRQT